MAIHSRLSNGYPILVWRIPWTEEPGGLQSMVRPLIKLKNPRDRAVLWEEESFVWYFIHKPCSSIFFLSDLFLSLQKVAHCLAIYCFLT